MTPQSPSEEVPWDLTQFSQLPSAALSYFPEPHWWSEISSLSKVILVVEKTKVSGQKIWAVVGLSHWVIWCFTHTHTRNSTWVLWSASLPKSVFIFFPPQGEAKNSEFSPYCATLSWAKEGDYGLKTQARWMIWMDQRWSEAIWCPSLQNSRTCVPIMMLCCLKPVDTPLLKHYFPPGWVSEELLYS